MNAWEMNIDHYYYTGYKWNSDTRIKRLYTDFEHCL